MRKVIIFLNQSENERITLGISLIEKALTKAGYEIEKIMEPGAYIDYRKLSGEKIYAGDRNKSGFIKWLEEEELLIYHSQKPDGEGFYLETCPNHLTVVSGASDAGVLYGCLELAERIKEEGELPNELAFYDAPVFKLRGPVVGLQKTKLEPPRLTYEYPITPGRFPWFYDKIMWLEFLDMMLKQRCNVLYIWSGHPFSSLVKAADYPEALEVTEEEYIQNREVFTWLTRECDKRGIWVILKFYNIHIPYPFAVHHNLELLQSNINPLVADYTAKSIIEFIKSFPHIGLMVCLGEALRGIENKTDWFIKTIIPAVKEGIKQAGLKEEPPVILRGHDCDPYGAMQEAKKIYTNLYTMWKYNGESLTTYFPKGRWREIHQSLSGLGTTHIMNIHILADLEPFRFNAPNYIQKCVQAGQYRLGANGIHLYPLFYWDWPYSPDKKEPRIKQIDRDFIWFSAWFRYAWNPNRDEKEEKQYWIKVLANHYGCNRKGASLLLDAMESAGRCAPKILGRVGITEGNRQTMSLGMTMSQLTNVTRYRPNEELWKSVAGKGERPDDYILKELKQEEHLGETPYDLVEEIEYLAEKAVRNCEEAKSYFSQNNDEFKRICSDIEAIYLMSVSYNKKIMAAMKILEYKYTMDNNCKGKVSLLEEALPLMAESLEYYKKLAELTEKTYLYANSMQTPQRKIPFPNGETYGHWVQCLPEYEKELDNFKKHLGELQKGILPGAKDKEPVYMAPLKGAEFKLLSEDCEVYTLEEKNRIFTDYEGKIENLIPELAGLTGIRFRMETSIAGRTAVKIALKEDSKVLIGYLKSKGAEWLQVPDLETNTHADDRGGLAVLYANAIKAEGCPLIDIHAFYYEKGVHEIYFGTGAFVIAGVVPADTRLIKRNADMTGKDLCTLDWLYE